MLNLRYWEEGIAVLESPPRCRTITVREHAQIPIQGRRPVDNTYYLAFPWLVFIITYNRQYHITLHLAFRHESLRQRDQCLLFPNLWNVYNMDLRICMESVRTNGRDEEVFFKEVISAFWNSTWTQSGSLHEAYRKAGGYTTDQRVADGNGPDWKAWQQNTREDPDFIRGVGWPRYGVLDDVIRYAHLLLKQQ